MNKLALIMLILGIIIFMTGLHSTDQAYNLHTINSETGAAYYDTNFFGQTLAPDELYNRGILMLTAGFLFSVMGCLFLPHVHRKRRNMGDVMNDYE